MYVEKVPPPTRPNPQKRNLLIQRLVKAPWWLLAMLQLIVYIYGEWSESVVYQTIWQSVRQGIDVTIYVAIWAYSIALLVGLTLALMRLSNSFFLYQPATLYVEIVRGIPTLVLVLYVAVSLTPKMVEQLNIAGEWMLEKHDLVISIGGDEIFRQNDIDTNVFDRGTVWSQTRTRDIENRDRAIVALAISYSAFLSEVFRAGIQSIDRGQVEAARSLGLSRFHTMLLIMLPQAIRIILPPLGNDFIAMLKETSLVAVLGVEDITRRGQTTAASTFRFFETYNVVAMTYLVLTLNLAILVKLIEAYTRSSRRIPFGAPIRWVFETVSYPMMIGRRKRK
ncbi:MAG: amino acid ABC transporter permease [Chloroflexi bacterium]|nr:amino acid ABC transporter permease [Chloroflexota bacterium]